MDEVVQELHVVQMVEGIEVVKVWLVSHSHQIYLINHFAVKLTFYTFYAGGSGGSTGLDGGGG